MRVWKECENLLVSDYLISKIGALSFYKFNEIHIDLNKQLCNTHWLLFFYCLFESSFFEKLMTYSGLVSGYIWSKKAKKKDNLIFF